MKSEITYLPQVQKEIERAIVFKNVAITRNR